MNYDEFAFFNQQLAGMLHSGIPLEGALHQLSSGMRRGQLRDEITRLEADLAQGIPLETALAARKLPPTYIQMVRAGVRSNDLPGTLTAVADHYGRLSLIFARLKGLMVYPVLVLGVALGLSFFLTFLHERIVGATLADIGFAIGNPFIGVITLWLPPITLLLLAVALCLVISSDRLRGRLKWRIPAFRDAYLAQLASTGEIMIRRGHTLPETLQLLGELERGTPAEKALAEWKTGLAEGRTATPDLKNPVLPPLFFWLLKSAGENLAEGFQRAAQIYERRAAYRLDLLLFAALPVSVILLGTMVLVQVYPNFFWMIRLMDSGFVGDW